MLNLRSLPLGASASHATWWLFAVAIAMVYLSAHCFYLLFLHPLSKYPGPRLAAVSSIWKTVSDASGSHTFKMVELHRKYGDIVRIGPNALSFTTVEAYRVIYGHVEHNKKRFLKSVMYEREEPRIVSARDPTDHAMQRRALSHAFSAQALRNQEKVVHQYVDLLIEQLGNLGDNGRKGVNVTDAYNWLTVDLIGDLSFGESFNALAEASNVWIEGILDWQIYTSLSFHMKKKFWQKVLFTMLLGSKLTKMRATSEKYSAMARDKATRRLARGDSIEHVDFFSHLIKKITAEYLAGNAQVLIVAGSEPSATALTSTTFWLVRHPQCLEKLQQEIRSTFPDSSDITGNSTGKSQCPYLHAVIEEALRLSPPIALGLPRDCPGAFIDGEWIPERVTVSCENYAMCRDPKYWQQPEVFKPERWIGDGLTADDKRAFQPFSTGPRACLGINLAYLELRVTLAKVVLAFDMELETQGIKDWNRACKLYGMWHKPSLHVKFHPRKII